MADELPSVEILPPLASEAAAAGVTPAPLRSVAAGEYGITVRQAFQTLSDNAQERAKERDPDNPAKIKRAGGSYRTQLKKLGELGFDVDSDLSVLNKTPTIDSLVDRMLEANDLDPTKFTDKSRGAMGTAVKAAINIGLPDDASNAVTKRELKHIGKKTGFNFEQTVRATTKLVLPDFDDFSHALHKGIKNIPDKEARGFAVIKLLSGIRDSDLMRIDTGVKELKPNTISWHLDPDTKSVRIFNKGNITHYQLGEHVYEILDELKQDAIKQKRSKLFSVTEDTLRKRSNKSIRAALKEAGLSVKIEATGKVKDFTMGDLRKNIFDMVEEKHGTAIANRLLGHTVKGDVGLSYYKVTRPGRVTEMSKTADDFFKMFGNAVKLTSPRNIFKYYKFKEAAEKVANVFKGLTVSPAQADIEGRIVDTTVGLDETVEGAEAAADKLEKVAGRTEAAQQRIAAATGTTEAPVVKQTDELLSKGGIGTAETATELVEFQDQTFESLDGKNKETALKLQAEANRTGNSTPLDDFLDQLDEAAEKDKNLFKKSLKVAGKGAVAYLATKAALAATSPAAAVASTVYDIADFSLMSSPTQGDPETASSEALLKNLQQGKTLEGGDLDSGMERRAMERELGSRVESQKSDAERKAMIAASKAKSARLFRPTKEQLTQQMQDPSFLGNMKKKIMEEARTEFEQQSFIQEYRGLIPNRPN